MPISPEFIDRLTYEQQLRCKELISRGNLLAKQLWSVHRQQDEMVAELSWLYDETPRQIHEKMAASPSPAFGQGGA
jgi:hypothetical protein